MGEKIIELNESTVNKVLQYLATKPYQEVFQLIHEIQTTAKIKKEGDNGNID